MKNTETTELLPRWLQPGTRRAHRWKATRPLETEICGSDLFQLIGRPGGNLRIANCLADRIDPRPNNMAEWFATFIHGPQTGIEALLLKCGYESPYCKFIAHAILCFGSLWARERNAIEKPIGSLMRELAGSNAMGTLAVSRRAEKLLALLDYRAAGVLLGRALRRADLPVSLTTVCATARKAASRNPNACSRLRVLARALAAHTLNPGGRRVTDATGVHLFLLYELWLARFGHGYSWDSVEGRCVDVMSDATRTDTGEPGFDPRFAYRLLMSSPF